MIVQFPGADAQDAAVGGRVRRIREARGLSQDRLALDMGLSREALARAEFGRAHLTSCQLYAASMALHVSLRLLAEDVDLSRLRPL